MCCYTLEYPPDGTQKQWPHWFKDRSTFSPVNRPILAFPLVLFLHHAKSNVVVLFMLSRPNAAGPWTVTSIYDELRCRDTTALKHLMSGYVASPAVSSVALKLPSIPALCAALTSKVSASMAST